MSGFSEGMKGKIHAAAVISRALTTTLASWDETEVETLPPALVKPAAVKSGSLAMEIHTIDLGALDLTCKFTSTLCRLLVISLEIVSDRLLVIPALRGLAGSALDGASGLTKLTTGTLDTLTMGASDKLLDEVGAGDLSDTFKHRWVVLWRHPDLTRGPYQLIWYES